MRERERERECERTNGDLFNNYYFYNNVSIYLNIRKRQHVLILVRTVYAHPTAYIYKIIAFKSFILPFWYLVHTSQIFVFFIRIASLFSWSKY